MEFNIPNQDWEFDELNDMPEFLRTNVLCDLIKHNQMSLGFIPCDFLNEEICICALKYLKYSIVYIYMCIPIHLRTESVNTIYAESGGNIQFIKEKDLTENICLAAVKNDEYSIVSVPYRCMTKEIRSLVKDKTLRKKYLTCVSYEC
jgi:hypothetical protein